jgi:glycosyltransferase involved in cell wall biosynthesis
MSLSFSIVVATLNRRDMLLAAIESIRAQNWPDVEIIIVDGGSNDGTLEWVAQQPDIILVPGPDSGVYDAFNKGFRRATGEIVGILNSDDRFELGCFKAVSEAFSVNPIAQAVCGTAVLVEDGIELARFADRADKVLATPYTALMGSCILNARFFHRAAMQKIGSFRIDFKFVADRDWLMRWYEARLATIPVAKVLYQYSQHAGSLTFDPDKKKQQGIYLELRQLACYWRGNESASKETQQAAAELEGRCIGRLALFYFRSGAIRLAVAELFQHDGHPSLRPLYTLARALWGRLASR